MSDDGDISELDYIRMCMEDFDLTPDDKISDLLEALREDEIDEFLQVMEERYASGIE